MSYKNGVPVNSGFYPRGDFPIANAKDIYVSDEERLDVAINNLQASIETIPTIEQIETIANTKITAPMSASVGQVLIVKEIDEEGKPIVWETIEPSYANGAIPLTQEEYERQLENGQIISTAYYYIYEEDNQ